MFLVLAPRSRKKICARFESKRPWTLPKIGEIVRLTVRGRRVRLRIVGLAQTIVQDGDVIEHRTIATTRALPVRRRTARRRRFVVLPDNVVPMPMGDDAVVANFLRYHVLMRVYDGDVDAWLAELRTRVGDPVTAADLRFARWVRVRLREDAGMLSSIRQMVDTTPFWVA